MGLNISNKKLNITHKRIEQSNSMIIVRTPQLLGFVWHRAKFSVDRTARPIKPRITNRKKLLTPVKPLSLKRDLTVSFGRTDRIELTQKNLGSSVKFMLVDCGLVLKLLRTLLIWGFIFGTNTLFTNSVMRISSALLVVKYEREQNNPYFFYAAIKA